MRRKKLYVVGIDTDDYAIGGKLDEWINPLSARQAEIKLNQMESENAVIYKLVPVDPMLTNRVTGEEVIVIDIKIKGLTELKKALSPERFKKIATRTLNKLGPQVKTAINREVRNTYNICTGTSPMPPGEKDRARWRHPETKEVKHKDTGRTGRKCLHCNSILEGT